MTHHSDRLQSLACLALAAANAAMLTLPPHDGLSLVSGAWAAGRRVR